MNVINIKNGILLDYNRNYSIYEMYTDDANAYFMCIANYETNSFETVIDFPEVYFNSLLQEQKISEIKNTCDSLYDNEHPYIYILPNITTYDITEAKTENDDHAYQSLLRELQKYTYNVYKSITNNNDDIKINQTIQIIVDTDDDKKFLDWLDINLNSYFKPLYLNRSNEQVSTNNTNTVVPTETKVETKNKPKIRKLTPNNKGFGNIVYIMIIVTMICIIALKLASMIMR